MCVCVCVCVGGGGGRVGEGGVKTTGWLAYIIMQVKGYRASRFKED